LSILIEYVYRKGLCFRLGTRLIDNATVHSEKMVLSRGYCKPLNPAVEMGSSHRIYDLNSDWWLSDSFHRTIFTICAMPKGRPRKSAADLIASAPEYDTAEPHPIPSTNPLLSIEHPAILSSIEAGIRSLGGQSALTKVSIHSGVWTDLFTRRRLMRRIRSWNYGTDMMMCIDIQSSRRLLVSIILWSRWSRINEVKELRMSRS
jgi:hypothetical protein